MTPARVLREIRRIALPAPAVSIQPPGGKTLVNFETIFSTEAATIERTLRIAGQRVQVRIEPSTYVWHFGDGAEPLRTHEPGRAWGEGVAMSEYLTHEYVDAHVTVRPSVDVVYGASFRVGDGPWQDVGETVTVPGPSTPLRIVEARPVLVGH